MKLWTITPSPSTSLPFHSQPGRGHGCLAQGEAAVVGGHQAVGQDFKIKLLQATFEARNQEAVLKHAPGQGDEIKPGFLSEEKAHIGEPRARDWWKHPAMAA